MNVTIDEIYRSMIVNWVMMDVWIDQYRWVEERTMNFLPSTIIWMLIPTIEMSVLVRLESEQPVWLTVWIFDDYSLLTWLKMFALSWIWLTCVVLLVAFVFIEWCLWVLCHLRSFFSFVNDDVYICLGKQKSTLVTTWEKKRSKRKKIFCFILLFFYLIEKLPCQNERITMIVSRRLSAILMGWKYSLANETTDLSSWPNQ